MLMTQFQRREGCKRSMQMVLFAIATRSESVTRRHQQLTTRAPLAATSDAQIAISSTLLLYPESCLVRI
jgi:hypothetical protein